LAHITDCVAKNTYPVKVLQFGEGNFLRAFADELIDRANEEGKFNGSVVIAKPRAGAVSMAFSAQNCLYTVALRGMVDGKAMESHRSVTCVTDIVSPYEQYDLYMSYACLESLQFVISNTTEAGIVYDDTDSFDMCPPTSFPAKLAKLLYLRCLHFDYASDKGLVILPAELIDDNGTVLKSYVCRHAQRWNLDTRFLTWLDEACVFANTLVDRIVTGYPADEAESLWEKFGYEDRLLVCGEPFALWVIESQKDISKLFPLSEQYVRFTDDIVPFKKRKVRILNGAHTSFSLASYLCGNDTVIETMRDPMMRTYIESTIFEEIMPTLSMSQAELESFASAVLDRFANPYIKHSLLAISLNSVSKWKARCLPTLKDFLALTGKLAPHLTFSLAALIQFYSGTEAADGRFTAKRGEDSYEIKDDPAVLAFFAENAAADPMVLTQKFLSNDAFWGEDLTAVPGLIKAVSDYLTCIRTHGMKNAVFSSF